MTKHSPAARGVAQMIVRFVIPGKPVAKGRPRFARGVAYTPAKTKKAEGVVAWTARCAVKGLRIAAGAVSVSIEITRQNKSKANRNGKDGQWAHGTPDLDNAAKLICDAMIGIVYADDRQIACLVVTRKWGPVDQTEIAVQKL